MGLFDKMKSMVGIGSPVLKIELEATPFSIHAPIQGTLTLTAKERATTVTALTVSLVCERNDVLSDGSTIKRTYQYGQCQIDLQNRPLGSGESLREDFALTVQGIDAVDPNVKYRLTASADIPGLDSKDDVEIQLDDAPPPPAEPNLGAWSDRGLLPMRVGLLPGFFQSFRPDEVVWLPKYDEAGFERGTTFTREQLTTNLLGKLRGRAVFVESQVDTVFGVLGLPEDGETLEVTYIGVGFTVSNSVGLEYLKEISLAELREPSDLELTYERLIESQEFNARMKGEAYDVEAAWMAAEELKLLIGG
jgi:hypothetical protein